MKPESKSLLNSFVEGIKKFYITKLKGFDTSKMAVATLLFEGTKQVCAFKAANAFNSSCIFLEQRPLTWTHFFLSYGP